MEDIEKYFLFVLEKLHDPTYFKQNKETIKNKISTGQLQEVVKKYLIDGKKYTVLKFIDRMDMECDNDLYLNYYKYEENKNTNLYTLFFSLYIKGLISTEHINKIKSKYNAESFSQLNEVERKCLHKKMETDRHFMKKERNRMAHENIVASVDRSKLLSIDGVTTASKRVYIIDVTDIFRLNSKKQNEFNIHRKIENILDKFFYCNPGSDEYLTCLNKEIDCKIKEQLKESLEIHKKRKSVERGIIYTKSDSRVSNDVQTENFANNYKFANYRIFSKDELQSVYAAYNYTQYKLKKAVEIFQHSKEKIYIISRVNLSRLLAESLVFGIFNIDPENFISMIKDDTKYIINLIKEKEKIDKIVFCGRPISSGEHTYVAEDISKLFEIAVAWKRHFENVL